MTESLNKPTEKILPGKSQALYAKAKTLIPGGTQLLSKRPEMFLPDLWPAYYSKASGCDIWDLDGTHYYDTAYMGVGANILGYCDPDVDQAVIQSIQKGSNTTLNAPEEVELAELLLNIHPWADMVRYARTGGEAMAIAVRIARAHTGKDKVLFCGYHGWHDWYISANLAEDKLKNGHLIPGLEPSGVPRALLDTAMPFTYNDTEGFLELINKHGEELGAVCLESVRNFLPEDGFLETVREVTREKGIVLIMDEITAGFRMNVGGAHLRFDVIPDIAVFGKALSNGYPMAALIGVANVMEAAQGSFISSLCWTDRVGPAATIATIRKMQQIDSPAQIIRIGKKVQSGWKEAATATGLDIKVMGLPAISAFAFQHDHPLEMKTFFVQEMLKKGFLASTALYASCAHTDEVIDSYLEAMKDVFGRLSSIISSGNSWEQYLEGPVCHSGFKRLT
ncbi:MAG: aminotransferase class III-fold pyridoxal phosphate-dependent enzyme [Bacteroidota bacterium]